MYKKQDETNEEKKIKRQDLTESNKYGRKEGSNVKE